MTHLLWTKGKGGKCSIKNHCQHNFTISFYFTSFIPPLSISMMIALIKVLSFPSQRSSFWMALKVPERKSLSTRGSSNLISRGLILPSQKACKWSHWRNQDYSAGSWWVGDGRGFQQNLKVLSWILKNLWSLRNWTTEGQIQPPEEYYAIPVASWEAKETYGGSSD